MPDVAETQFVVKRTHTIVSLIADNVTYELSSNLSRELGEALYKAGCDAKQREDQEETK